MRRIKPTERNPRPNQVVSVVAVRTIHETVTNDRGTRLITTCIEYVVGRGKYLGVDHKVTAFIWLEDKTGVLKAA
ncbi:hypothetical protein [Ferrovum myxofaciens]|jgi:hypothetical protein|uniref:Uncharacterized protein n=1 Tax=Ferrovum myxofaciens TaxID=416213 RepID=A0A859A777_9PROT|nr:hypothetical protein [Ferrovum myxofaciens]KXW57244.1 hypothetical protein FEMY_22390 [Ferrovum myxofaciens]QKE37518.1 MAG: hypothetical protein HO273_01165 [Ferrovum myxofaciens]QWY75168.1 MAG: hypothetical protein JVY19_01595 [Ferrovum myxofaciens]QWY77900.1 MAG: hypothetical protein JZL65_02085 [Ferrovum myxofaciens]